MEKGSHKENKMNLTLCIATSLVLCFLAIYVLNTTQEIIGLKPANADNQEKSQIISLQKQENLAPCENSTKQSQPTTVDVDEKLQNIVNKWKEKASKIALQQSQIYKRKYSTNNNLPYKKYPFVFFHQRKAGGTSFKEHLFKQSNKKHKAKFIASYGDVQWGTFTIPNRADKKKESYDIYAGHFNYMHVYSTIAIQDAKKMLSNQLGSTYPAPFSCVINARPTIERVFSCWNYFFLQELKLNDKLPNSYNVTSDQWEEYLPKLYSIFHHGCNNEFIRNFADSNNEIFVNNLVIADDSAANSFLLESILESVLSRVSQCSIMLLPKCQESVSVIKHYHPWLDIKDDYCEVKYNVGKEEPKTAADPSDDDDTIPKEVRDAISKYNRLDDLVFEFLEVLFDEQYKLSLK